MPAHPARRSDDRRGAAARRSARCGRAARRSGTAPDCRDVIRRRSSPLLGRGAAHRHEQRAAHRAADAAVSGRALRADPRQPRHAAAQARQRRVRRARARGGRTAAARHRVADLGQGARRRPACRRPARASSRSRFARATSACARLSRAIDDRRSHAALDAERAVVEALGGGCQTPIGALASPIGAGRARARRRRRRRSTAARAISRHRAWKRGRGRRPSARVSARSCWPTARATSWPRPTVARSRRRDSAVTRATVYLIGAGPGDPGLITVRGLQCLDAADVVLYDHLVHPRLLRHARRGRREDRRRRRRAAAARAGGDLLPARREGARGQDRRAAQVGRSVRVRSRRRGSAVPARAGRALRGGARRSGRHRRAELRRHPRHLSRRRRHADVRARPRGRRQGARLDRLGEPRAARRHHRLLRRPAAAAGHPQLAALARPARPTIPAAVIYDGTLPTQETLLGSLDELPAADARVDRPAARHPRRRARRGAARAPALVRRAAAVRQAHAGHAARASRPPSWSIGSKRWAPKRSRRR